jgi:hypothetical protein
LFNVTMLCVVVDTRRKDHHLAISGREGRRRRRDRDCGGGECHRT